MSSDGSVSSRISQFGLYRTIDARTEEFLKLSKKRQIKQGCVCAAISTAVTVTVVVTVLLIYEYNVIAEARRSSHKANWLALMNKSGDDSNLQEILNKEKIVINNTTLKLLPILLKALNQNSYIEKIIEEPTSPYTPYEKDITTETTVTKNIFADTRNWMKTPYSRLYAIEYKTSPMVYFKNPTRNIEYFTKIRKIRDYQRILNYVDKMISEKNYLGTTQPMRSDYGHTEQPYKMITPTRKHKSTQKLANMQKVVLKATAQEKSTNCKCSNKLSDVMHKLLNSIQQLLLYLTGSNTKEQSGCKMNNSIKSVQSIKEKSSIKSIQKVTNESIQNLKGTFTRTPSYKTFLNRHKYTIENPPKSFNTRRDYTVNAIMNLIKPNFNKHNEVDINFESNEAFSTTNSYVKSLNTNKISRDSSSPSYIELLDNTYKNTPSSVTTVADYILQKGTYDITPDMRSRISTFPESDFNDDDYAETTEITSVTSNTFKPLNTHSLELENSNLISKRKINISEEHKSYTLKGARRSHKLYDNIRSMRKMGNLALEKKKARILPYRHRFAPTSKDTSKSTKARPQGTSQYKINVTSTMKPTKETTTNKYIIETVRKEPKKKVYKHFHTNKITSIHKAQKESDENFSKETTLKQIEEAIMMLNNETTNNQVVNYNKISTDAYQWDITKSVESTTLTKPLGRSTYLEMQRNEWRQEENHDFDTDVNYIFD